MSVTSPIALHQPTLNPDQYAPLGESIPADVSALFRLDKTLPLEAALHKLPFVYPHEIEMRGDPATGTLTLQAQQVMLERVVSARADFGSWAAKGVVKTMADGASRPSLEHAKSFVASRPYAFDSEDPLVLMPFTDNTGATWFRAIQGSHRILAAKINDEETVVADIKTTADGNMAHYDGDVIGRAAHTEPETQGQGREFSEDDLARLARRAARAVSSQKIARRNAVRDMLTSRYGDHFTPKSEA